MNSHARLISARFSPGNGIVHWQEEQPEPDFGGQGPTALPPRVQDAGLNGGHGVTALPSEYGTAALPFVGMTLGEMEEQLIRLTLERFNGHRAKTAAALGIGLRTLTTKIKGLGTRG